MKGLSLAALAATRAATLAATLAAASPAWSYFVYRDEDEGSPLVVEIERPYGDLVALGLLPQPFDRLLGSSRPPSGFHFLWHYQRGKHGIASFRVGEDGAGVARFEFFGDALSEGETLGAAAVLVDAEGRPLQSLFARSRTSPRGARHVVQLALDRPPAWWRSVTAVAFFYMQYGPPRNLDGAGIDEAMRRAVRRFTKGQGAEQGP